jgi:hypothetical protein
MAADPIYIDKDAELPEVVERLRWTAEPQVPLVLEAGSHLIRGRFDFQLLRQCADRMGRQLVIVSPDPAILVMAQESGLHAFVDLSHYDERAVAGPPPEPGPALGGARRTPAAAIAPSPADPAGSTALAAASSASVVFGRPAGTSSRGRTAGVSARSGPPLVAVRMPSRLASLTDRLPPLLGVVAPTGRARTVLYVAAAALLLTGLISSALFVPSASVTLVADAKPFSADLQLTTTPGHSAFGVRSVSETKTVSGTFPVSGNNTTAGAQARGSVAYQNRCPSVPPVSSGQLQIAQGTVLTSQSGVQFVQQDTVQVSSGQTATASVSAAQPGANGNVPAGQVSQLANAGPYAACLQVTNPAPLSGGQDNQQQQVVSQADIDKARTQLEQQARQSIVPDLQSKAQPGEKLSDQVLYQAPSFQPDHKVNDAAKTFNATVTLRGDAALYNQSDVNKAMAAELAKRVPSGQQLTSDSVQSQYQVTTGSDGHLMITGHAAAYVAPKLDLRTIKDQLPGKPTGQAQADLGKLPVRHAEIHQSPLPLPMLPVLGSRVELKYVVEQGSAAPPTS